MSYPYPPYGSPQQPPVGPPPGGGYPPQPGGWGSAGPGFPPGFPPGPPPGFPPGFPPGPPPGPPNGPPRSNTGLIVGLVAGAVILVVVAVVTVVAVVNLTGAQDPRGATASVGGSHEPTPSRGTAGTGEGPVPADYDGDPSWRLWDPLNERSGDSGPLTVAEVFDTTESRATTDTHGTRYALQGTGRSDSDCAAAVWGERLEEALAGYGCTQVVRGVYADTSNRIVGHVGVFDLRDVIAADQFVKDLDPDLGKGFLIPLPGRPAPLDRFGSGFTGADAGAYGHFVVVSWVGFTDGSSGASADFDGIAPRSALERAAKNFLFDRLAEAR